ncbi:enoyl-CoA hydratase/isomerase family protein [Paraferrimonas sedimenticola]|uniref:Enoyl-CoA hydratase n=1 Tax=Paraferrimonas sedimenticola TaxID=375674 RepID=A0AA37RRS0_9GAMM|nr:enoyl-CoA hydratase/isomerase family protein [Paraferrimonas sedimenticola]GLP94863.1 enoyl-CoA hydratase [Paraferrimonas sedimenticola]
MTQFQTILLECEGSLAKLHLNRPDAANGMSGQMLQELADATTWLRQQEQIKLVVISASGRFFCAGGDINYLLSIDGDIAPAVEAQVALLNLTMVNLAEMDALVLCAVNGVASGAGFSLAVAADMVIATRAAKFTMAYSNIGFSPDGGASYYLPRLVGMRKAQELIYTSRLLSADEAHDWGLINQVVDDQDFEGEVTLLTHKLLSYSKTGQARAKGLLRATDNNSLQQQLAIEARDIGLSVASQDGQEGMNAFMQKRQPQFK